MESILVPAVGSGKLYLRVHIHSSFGHARSRPQPLAWSVTVSGICSSGQVRSECLTYTFRANCCSACLSQARVPAHFSEGILAQFGWSAEK